jgi:hypothetical protein
MMCGAALSGLFWGTLIGLLLLFPLAPLAGVAGGSMGAAPGTAGDLGIKDEFKPPVQDLVQPGTSAILVTVRKATPGHVPRPGILWLSRLSSVRLRRHRVSGTDWLGPRWLYSARQYRPGQ